MDIEKINITQNLQECNFGDMLEVRCFFKDTITATRNLQVPYMLKRGTMQRQDYTDSDNVPVRTVEYSGTSLEWPGAVYNDQAKQLNYYFHNNPKMPGVNILVIPLDSINNPHFISSGTLSGCAYAWFLLEDKVVFLHAGADSGNTDTSDPIERDNQKRADIVNGLNYVLHGAAGIAYAALDPIEMVTELRRVNELITGQIIHSNNTCFQHITGKLHTMAYTPREAYYGESLCCIAPVEGQVLISGMVSMIKPCPSFTRQDYQIYRVNRRGQEC